MEEDNYVEAMIQEDYDLNEDLLIFTTCEICGVGLTREEVFKADDGGYLCDECYEECINTDVGQEEQNDI